MRQGRKEQRERDWLDRILDELQARKEQGESPSLVYLLEALLNELMKRERKRFLAHLIHAWLEWRAEQGEGTSLGTEGMLRVPCPLTRRPGKGALEGLISPQTWGRDIAPLPVVASPTTPPRG